MIKYVYSSVSDEHFMYTMSLLGGQISKRERERERERESIKSGNQELCFAALLTCV